MVWVVKERRERQNSKGKKQKFKAKSEKLKGER
jgi:hypothetical protein